MKNWTVTYTLDKEVFNEDEVKGYTYTDAYVNTMIKHPGALITNLKEV